MTGKLVKKLVILFVIVGILLSGIMMVNTNIQATVLEPPGGELISLLSNDAPPYPHYVHNNPTPPTGDTNRQADLPLDTTPPTATTLYNYDQDANASAGRQINKNGGGASESNLVRYQNWRTNALSQDLTIDGVVNFPFWSGTANFKGNRRGVVEGYLRDYNGSVYTEITSGTVDISDWQGGSSTWVQYTLVFSSVNYTVPAGNQLEFKITVGSGSQHMWFAYDTTTYYSYLQFP